MSDNTTPPVADRTEPMDVIANLLDLSPRRLQQLAAKNIIPKAVNGRYNLVLVVQGYVKYLRGLVASRGTNELQAEQLRIARERADGLARNNATARGELIPREDVVVGIQEMIAHCRARLLSIPNKAAPVLAMIDEPVRVKEKLTEMIHDALKELSRTRAVPTKRK